jgi:SAM-dependent methyltransferase
VSLPLRLAAAAVATAPPDPSDVDPGSWRDDAVRHELAQARRLPADDPEGADRVIELARHYDALLAMAPVSGPDGPRWVPVADPRRRRLGAFATPPGLAEALVDRAWPVGSPPGAGDPDRGRSRGVVDPACGTGALLTAALVRLVGEGVPAQAALARLYGVDLDGTAVDLARAALVAQARRLGAGGDSLDAVVAGQIVVGDALVDGAGFGWRATLPQVLARPGIDPDPVTGWSGGFAVVLANPPWERLKVAAAEHLGPDLGAARSRVSARVRQVREGGRHPLTGTGDLNAHLPFLETCWRLLGDGGRAALLVPQSALTDRQAGALVRELLAAGGLTAVHGLADGVRYFPGVSAGVRVALVALCRRAPGTRHADPGTPGAAGPGAQVIMGSTDPRRPDPSRAWTLDRRLLDTVSPSSGTAVLFASGRDARLVAAAHERFGVLLGRAGDGSVGHDPWGFRARTPIHLSREARWLRRRPGPGLLPLVEAKLVALLDPRAATWDAGAVRPADPGERLDPTWLPAVRWWVPEELVRARYGYLLRRGWLAGYRVVTTGRSPRTLLPVALPAGAYANSLALLDAPRLPLLLTALAALPTDYLVRARGGGNNLSLYKIEQVPVPPPQVYDGPAPWAPGLSVAQWLTDRLVAAIAWSDALRPLADELGRRAPTGSAPEVLRARATARAEIDAAHAVLLGWTRSDLEHVLGTFGALRAREESRGVGFRTRIDVLAAYTRLTGQ